MKKKLIAILLLSLCITVCSGCHSDSAGKGGNDLEKEKNIQIGFSFDSFVVERWQRDRDVFVAKANEMGADVNVQNANGSATEQEEQIYYFIEKKMDVIVVVPIDTTVIEDAIKAAKDAGIHVIAYDRLISNIGVDLYISFDNEEVGRLMAKSLADNVTAGGNVVGIYGPTSDNNVSLVVEGFQTVIEESSLHLIDTRYAEGWLAEEAFTAINEVIENNEIAGVMCGNDNLATEAIRALSERRLAGRVYVVGQDADLNACQRIVEGTQTMTVYKPVEKLAKAAAEYAVKLAKGEEIQVSDTFFDGVNEIPYEKLTPIAVTKDNIDEVIIEGGFHLKEDVYLNVDEQ